MTRPIMAQAPRRMQRARPRGACAGAYHAPVTRPAPPIRDLFRFKPAPPQRLWFSLRAGACVGAPVLAGWLAGDVSAGMMVAIGGFTGLYGSGRAYAHRAVQLALIALAFALATALGMWSAAGGWWIALPVIAVVAVVATWIGNALRIGPPGAYMFMLACAAATAMPAGHLSPALAALLVAAGGGFSWLVHMAGALFDPRGPERKATRAAGHAVLAYAAATGTAEEDRARHGAAFALQNAWDVLVNQQPPWGRGSLSVGRLRTLLRDLHLAFAAAMGAASRGQPLDPALAPRVGGLLAAVDAPATVDATGHDQVPPGHPRARDALMEPLRPGSGTRRLLLRVAIAALLAGGLAAMLHLDRAYWAVAAAVLLLFQGFDWVRMLQRSTERVLGTLLGLLLGGAILWWHPQGPWLVFVVVVLQVTVEMLVVRNYAVAVVFITGAALTLASGGHPVADPVSFVLARGVDTLLGVIVALAVYRALPPRPATATLPMHLRRTIDAVAALVPCLAAGQVTTPAARDARGAVQHAAIALVAAHEAGLAGSRAEIRAAEEAWPAIVSADRLAFRALSACWSLEALGGRGAVEAAQAMFAGDGAARLQAVLAGLSAAVGHDGAPPGPGPLPHVLGPEVRNLRDCLVLEPAEASPAGATVCARAPAPACRTRGPHMHATIYHNPRCGTSRNTLALIRHAGIEPEVVEYLEDTPSRDALVALIRDAGIGVRDAIRAKEAKYAELGLDDPSLSDDALLDAMLAEPILINRPFVRTDLGVRLSRPSEVVLDILPPLPGPFTKEDGEVVAPR